MAITILQKFEGPGPDPAANTASYSKAWPSKVTTNSCLVVFGTVADSGGYQNYLQITDTEGDTFNKQSPESDTGGAGDQSVVTFVANQAVGDSSTPGTVTVGLSGGHTEYYQAFYALELSGCTASPVVGDNAQATNTVAPGATFTSGSITLTSAQVPCLLIATAVNTSTNGTPRLPGLPTGSPLTQLDTWSGFWSGSNAGVVATQLITTPGTYTPTFQNNSSANEDMACNAVCILQATTAAAFAAVGAATSSVSASLSTGIPLGSTAVDTATVGAALTTNFKLAATAGAVTSATATLPNVFSPSTMRAVTSATAALSIAAKYVAATAASVSSLTGALLTGIVLGATATAVASGSATASTAGQLPNAGCRAVSTVSATLTTGAGLAASARATTSATAVFAGPAILTAAATTVTSSAAALSTRIALNATGAGLAETAASLLVATPSGLSFGALAGTHAAAGVTAVSTTANVTSNNSGFVVGLICRAAITGDSAWDFSESGVSFGSVAYTMDGSPASTPLTVTDSFGNTYQQIGSWQAYAASQASVSLWYCPQGSGGLNHTFTAHLPVSCDASILVQEIQSSRGYGIVLDQGMQSTGLTTAPISTVNPQEALISLFAGFSATTPANLTVGPSLYLKATSVNGSTGWEAIGGFAGAMVTALQTGLTETWSQAGNSGAATFLASFYAATAPGNLFAAAAGVSSAQASLSTAAQFAGAAASTAGATATLTSFASVTLVSLNAYTGIGSIYDPYFWEDAVPTVGVTVYYDPTWIIVQPTGDIISRANNVNAVVQFAAANGTGFAQGLIQLTSGEAAYPQAVTSATASLSTTPSVFGGTAPSVSSATASLSTGIVLGAASATVSTVNAPLAAGILLVAPAVSVDSVSALLTQAAVLNATASAVSAVTGAVTLKQVLAAHATGRTIVYGKVEHGAQFQAQAPVRSHGTAALTTRIPLAGSAFALSKAAANPTVGAGLFAAAPAKTTVRAALLTRIEVTSGATARATGQLSALATGHTFAAVGYAKAQGAAALHVATGFAAVGSVLTRVSAVLPGGVLLQARALAIVTSDPEFTTLQSPIGMYAGDPNFMVTDDGFLPQTLVLHPAASRVITFDFTYDLAAEETLAGVASQVVTCSAGADVTPTDIVAGVPSFNTALTQVLLPVSGLLATLDCDYYIAMTSPTTNPQKTLTRYALVQVRN